MSETKRISIIDKDGSNKLASVVATTSDPTKNGLVICNADGTPIGGSNDKGWFTTPTALTTAYPVGQSGWYATVGTTDTMRIWDADTSAWLDSGQTGGPFMKLDQSASQTIVGGQPIQNTLTASEIVATDANKKLQSLAVATYPSLTELSYVKGVTSTVQTQIDSKLPKQFAVDINRYGFVPGQTTLSFDGTSKITIAPVSTTWQYYRAGVLYTITGSKEVTLTGSPVATGFYYVYIDSTDGTITQPVGASAWDLNDTKVPVCTLYFNDALTPKFVLTDERHTCLIDRRFHMEHHYIEGTKLSSGGAPTDVTLNTESNVGNVFGISGATIFDEDLYLTASTLTKPDGATPAFFNLYRTAATTYERTIGDQIFKYADLGGGTYGYIQYDNAGTMTASANNRYVNYFLFVSNARASTEATQGTSTSASRFMFIPGRASHSTTAAAYAETIAISAGFPVAEGVATYMITFSTGGVANTVKGRCEINRVQQINANVVSVATISTASHNTLSGIQGGTASEYYHLTAAELTDVQSIPTKASIGLAVALSVAL